MGTSLKDELLKLGLKKTEIKPKTYTKKETTFIKKEQPTLKKEPTFTKGRNFCDDCKKTLPDVEHYDHKAPTKAKWLCTACADKYAISDSTRTTNSSDFSRRGIFRREYGETKRFPITR